MGDEGSESLLREPIRPDTADAHPLVACVVVPHAQPDRDPLPLHTQHPRRDTRPLNHLHLRALTPHPREGEVVLHLIAGATSAALVMRLPPPARLTPTLVNRVRA